MTVLWTFPARLVSIHDGDTIKVEADLGFNVRYVVNVRLGDVYAPELHDKPDQATGNPGGAAALQFVVDWFASRLQSWPIVLHTTKLPSSPDTFDRYVAEVTDSDGVSLNAAIRRFLGDKQYGRGVG